MRVCGVLLMLLAALVLAACGGDSRPKAVKAESLPGYVVEADGHKVYFNCAGKGSPTVVFLSGWGGDSSNWDSVFDQSAHLTRSCEYDRYGTGLTSAYGALPPKPRDARDQIREFEQLLENADIAQPYVLVGHSWGGALARLYAGTHDDVKAVVFVDAAAPGQDAALVAALPPKRADEPQLFTEVRNMGRARALENPEYLDWEKSLDEVGKVTSLGDRPEVVVTAGSTFGQDQGPLVSVWRRLQNELAGLSSQSVHVLAPTSSHFVQADAPEVVQAAVRAAVNATRDEGQLASCATIFRGVSGAKCVR
jgi:pimeloyl-ACP methyl ester carboxylesterase